MALIGSSLQKTENSFEMDDQAYLKELFFTKLPVMRNTSEELRVFEMTQENCFAETFDRLPYIDSSIPIPKVLPCRTMIKEMKMATILENSSMKERLVLSRELIYAADFDNRKTLCALQIAWVPQRSPGKSVITLLTNCGALQLWRKSEIESRWNELLNDVSGWFVNVSKKPEAALEDIKNFKELKDVIDRFWITAFSWAKNGRQLYVGTAAGELVTLAFSAEDSTLRGAISVSARQLTAGGRIVFLQSFGTFLLVGTIKGVIEVYSVEPTLSFVSRLWAHPDRLPIRKACTFHLPDNGDFIVVTSKKVSVLAYRLDAAGHRKDDKRLLLDGLNFTGMEAIGDKQLLLSTITGVVYRLRIYAGNKLCLKSDVVNTDVDSTNTQIVGMEVSPNGVLCYLKLKIKKAKKVKRSDVLSVCSISIVDPIAKLNASSGPLNMYLDCLVVMCLKMSILLLPSFLSPYGKYCDLSCLELSCLDAALLQKLHIKLHLVRFYSRMQKYRLNYIEYRTKCELDFLQNAVQLLHLLDRRKRLSHAAGSRVDIAFKKLIEPMLEAASNPKHPLRFTNERFAQTLAEQWAALPEVLNEGIVEAERCINYRCPITEWEECAEKHKVLRCCVTFEQVGPWVKRKCAVCQTYAQDEGDPKELSCCTVCNFAFTIDPAE